MENPIKELFDVKIKHQDYHLENKLLVALVYDEKFENGLFKNDAEVPLKFREYLKSEGFNLENVEIFITDNERILGMSIRFDKVYIDHKLPTDSKEKVQSVYNKAEVITLL